jgi:hypothetical protein
MKNAQHVHEIAELAPQVRYAIVSVEQNSDLAIFLRGSAGTLPVFFHPS